MNRRPSARQALEDLIKKFREFLLIDLRRNPKTAYEHVYYVRKFLSRLNKPLNMINAEDVREYLRTLNGSSSSVYKNTLGALKLFLRDFLGKPQAVQSFKFPRQQFKPKRILGKEDLKRFYECLESSQEKALFLLYGASGLRRNEILSLKPEDVDFNTHMITPNNHNGETKKSWLSFYNQEAENVLREYLNNKKTTRSKRIFSMPRIEERRLWKIVREKTGLNVTPQRLREWFCCEMASLSVSDRYIDAFCGRTPKSVLAKNYTEYSPEKLKQIYEKANLKVLA